MDVASAAALTIGIMGVAGVVFTAMRFRRDDTTAIVDQQTSILNNMHTLNDELRISSDSLRSERDKCYEEVAKLRQVTQRIDDKLDG